MYRVVTRNKQVSAQAEIVNLVLGFCKPRRLLKRVFMNPSRTNSPLQASKSFSTKYDTIYHAIYGTEIMTAKPNKMNNIHLVYLHGGAYVLGKNGFKRNESIISLLIDNTGAKVSFIDYPVAPESKYTQTLEKTYKAYVYLVEEYPEDRFMLVGDSAGGGLALSLAQIITKRNKTRRPEKLVLFSPWLDLSLENPGIPEQADKDMILSKESLLYAAEKYAEPSVFKDSLVSPIYGCFKEMGPTIMFFGSFELFYPDGLKMKSITEKQTLDICFRFYPEMPHDWVIFPIPEAKYALQEATDFILS